MIRKFVFAAVLISLTSCVVNKKNSSPFVGTWKANFDECTETWVIDNNGIRKSLSGEEETENKFTISKIEADLYEIVDTRLSTNSKPDCSGEVVNVPIGNVTNGLLKFKGNDTFILCNSEQCLEDSPFIRQK